MTAITKEWLSENGFRVLEKPDRRKSRQLTVFSRPFPGHLIVRINYWEYPRSEHPDGIVVSTATYGGGPLHIPTRVMKSREDLSRLVECLCGVDLLGTR